MDSTDTISDRALRLARLTVVRRIITALAVTASALLQAFVIQAFVNPADLLPSGFTGIAVLLDRITALGEEILQLELKRIERLYKNSKGEMIHA